MKRPNRREALAGMAAMAAGTVAARSSRADTRPNIVFILSDDHRYDALGFMDKPWLVTPNMDRIASEGVHFENSFVTTSLCSPSRASFLTGQYARCHGVINNVTPWRDDNTTFLEVLHARGYRTGFFGKWHMPGKGVPDLAGQGKADRMVSFNTAGGQGLYNDCPLVVDGQKTKSPGYITDVLTDYALEFMDGRGPGPFCLYLSHKAVHAFFEPPERHRGKLAGAPLPKLQASERDLPLGLINGQQRANFEKNAQGYYEALMGVDDSVGAVLRLLDDRGWAENTLVVYAGDNGYFWGEHGLTDKRYAYEEGIRIPHLARWPRAVVGPMAADQMVLNVDLMPTLLEAAEAGAPAGIQGRSWLHLLAPAQPLPGRSSWLYEYFDDPGFPNPPIKAVRTRDWKLITYAQQGRKRLPDEMYDLVNDPGEHHDLASDPAFAENKAELARELERLDKELPCQTG